MSFEQKRLYTWVDIEQELADSRNEDWPASLVWARVYWDGVYLGIRPQTQDEVLTWLAKKFEPNIEWEAPGELSIRLESLADEPRKLGILCDETLPMLSWLPDLSSAH
ncbi:MAG: hypothetical protein AAF639_18060 [Chloroflexota bacterium]